MAFQLFFYSSESIVWNHVHVPKLKKWLTARGVVDTEAIMFTADGVLRNLTILTAKSTIVGKIVSKLVDTIVVGIKI